MKKTLLLMLVALIVFVFARCRSDKAKADVLRNDVARITVIHISEERVKTFLGRSAFNVVPERWITIIEFQRNGRRIMAEGRDVYEMMLPWNNKAVVVSYKENPFRLCGVREINFPFMALLVWPGEPFSLLWTTCGQNKRVIWKNWLK